jgi:hypothetical protein
MAITINMRPQKPGRWSRTYSTAIRSPHHIVVLKLEILVEDGGIQLDLAIKFVAQLFPVRRGLRHVMRWLLWNHGCHRCGGAAVPKLIKTSVRKLSGVSDVRLIFTWYKTLFFCRNPVLHYTEHYIRYTARGYYSNTGKDKTPSLMQS